MRRILLIILFLVMIFLVVGYAYSATTQATQPDDTAKAHIRQMIAMGTPELAETQARELISRGDYDPMAIGVVAFTYAARDEMGAAVQQLKMALQHTADETFLLRTAGQFVAWYDTTIDRSKLTATDVASIEWLRSNASNKPAFAEAYRIEASSKPIVPPPTPPAVVEQQQPREVIVTAPVTIYEEDRGYIAYPIFTNPFRHVPDHHRKHVKTKGLAPPRDWKASGDDQEGVIVRQPPKFRGPSPHRESSPHSGRDAWRDNGSAGSGRGGSAGSSRQGGFAPSR